MNYQVLWQPAAEAELARLWLEVTDRVTVEQAANAIDRQLRHSPLDVGESRDEGFRLVLVAPLGVKYLVLESELQVLVVNVWRFRRRS